MNIVFGVNDNDYGHLYMDFIAYSYAKRARVSGWMDEENGKINIHKLHAKSHMNERYGQFVVNRKRKHVFNSFLFICRTFRGYVYLYTSRFIRFAEMDGHARTLIHRLIWYIFIKFHFLFAPERTYMEEG